MPQYAQGGEMVLMASAIAVMLSEGLSANYTKLLASLFNTIGQNLSAIAVQKQLCDDARK